MINLLKGILVGISSVVPGFSGSALLVILGLYENTIDAIGTLFKNLKKNILFLTPIFAGFVIGILLFSNIIDFLLTNYEKYTRYAFLGLVIGTIPLFKKEVVKHGFDKKYLIPMFIAFLIGLTLIIFQNSLFPQVTDPTVFQSIFLGFVLASSMIIPGVASATILSTFGLYELYISSVANMELDILLPAAIGAIVGVFLVSIIIRKLLKKHYTLTFSVLFGLFISIIPSVLNESSVLGLNLSSFISIIIMILGFLVSYGLGRLKK